MGFQPDVGATVVVAKLTDLGTKYLLTDPDRFIIKKFAAYDDEIDYGLWNEDHANGNAYFGEAIESIHLLEPIKSSTWQCKYPLIKDFPRDIIRLPFISLDTPDITIPNLTDDAQCYGEVKNISISSLDILISDASIFDIQGGSTPMDSQYAASGLTDAGGFQVPHKAKVKVDSKGNFAFNLNARIVTSTRVATYRLTIPNVGIATTGRVTVSQNNELKFNKS